MRESRHTLIRADAADLSRLADSSIALVVTSPPYPMIEMWDDLFRARDAEIARALDAGDGNRAFDLMHRDLDRAWREVFRLLIDGGWACINIGDATRTMDGRFRLYPNHARVVSACSALGFDILPAVLWRKQTNAPNKFMGSGMLPAGAYVTLEHEYILIMRKGSKREFSSPDQRATRRQSAFFWEERNRWFSDVWDFKGTRQALGTSKVRDRSGAFPFELPFRLVNMYSVQGDTVLDPFVGTGTTTLAAMASGRSSIGVDTDEDLLAVARASAAGARQPLNDFLRQRAQAHLDFLQSYRRDKGELPHANVPHGFAVMTAQEEDLRLTTVTEVRLRDDGRIEVAYGEAGSATATSSPTDPPPGGTPAASPGGADVLPTL